ncbi:GrpB family protein [Virgibacillus ndiopensis]|uniref:GrpB family protein n=1 Tax=Virgibacillus ndiopensis TaxID=2004408 RepID=UPI000C08CECD|nr:GrpB family protein [Virgibacillus ndiopensis]
MNVTVTDYNQQWIERFKDEANRLKEIFGSEIVEIHHFGSTSVPGIKAKPIIDIMPLVKDIEKVDSFNHEMIALGYEPLGEYGIKGRRYFRKGGDNRTHQVHIFQLDNDDEVDRHLAVRDYLRNHPKDAQQYGDLKEKLAKQFPNDIEAYMDGKDEFVKELERKALDWYKN